MKYCELCKGLARMYCESDNASLCWECDAKVHSANFLAARHSRSLLCQECQSPAAWSAAGAKLRPIVSVCERCVDGYHHRDEIVEDSESVIYPGSNTEEDDELEIDSKDIQDDSGSLSRKRKVRTSPSVKVVYGCDEAVANVDSRSKRRKAWVTAAKIQRTEADRIRATTGSTGIVKFIRRNNGQRMSSSSTAIAELCRLSDDSRTVDLESSDTS